MASSLNKVMLMGNITRDIELRHTAGNRAVATVGLAVNHRWKTPEGEQREEVVFVDCDAWGKTAEVITQFFSKGRPIMIEGRLKLDQWDDKTTGKKMSKLRVVIENFYFVDSKPGQGGGGNQGDGAEGSSSGGGNWAPRQTSAPRQSSAPAPKPAAATAEPMGEEDIPF